MGHNIGEAANPVERRALGKTNLGGETLWVKRNLIKQWQQN